MERRGKASLIITFLAVVIALEFVFVASRLSESGHTDYFYDSSYSIVMDSPSAAPGPGNVTVLLDVTNTGTVDGRPVLHLHVFTYGGHEEDFEVHLGTLAKGGGHLNTTWQEPFGFLDPDHARVLIYVLDG